jgi:hypothetical protein
MTNLNPLLDPSINFPVELRDIGAINPQGSEVFTTVPSEPGVALKFGLDRIPNRKAVVRTDTNQILNVVSDRYKLVTHPEAFAPILEAVEQLGLPVKKASVTTANQGAFARIKFVLGINDDITPDDNVRLVLTARNSLNYESILTLSAEGLREICTNGMMAPIPGFSGAFAGGGKHTTNLNVSQIMARAQAYWEGFPQMVERWQKWQQIDLAPEDFTDALLRYTNTIGKKTREEIVGYYITQPDRAGAANTARHNLWEAYNAITWFASHRVKSKADRTAVTQDQIQRLAVKFANDLYVSLN